MKINARSFFGAVLIFAVMLLVGAPLMGHASASTRPVVPGAVKDGSGLILFEAGNHVLGFAPDKAYLAARDHALTVEFIGGSRAIPKPGKPLSVKKGGTSPSLGAVTYRNLWKGISLTYKASKDGITESVYHVAPGADVSKIALGYNVPVELEKNGDLKLTFKNGYMTESAPVAWQEIKGKRIPVDVAFRVSEGRVGFTVGAYDRKQPLVIDPTYKWHTFYGTTSFDQGLGMTIDKSGNIYLTGTSGQAWNGPSDQAPVHAHSGAGTNIVILKLNSSGEYVWHTFHGDSYVAGEAIAIDESGDLYVTGFSEATWNGPEGALPVDGTSGGFFVLKVGGSDGAYKWHTFLGSGSLIREGDELKGIVCSKGFVYITGNVWRNDFNGPDDALPLYRWGHTFIAKYDGADGKFKWFTWYSPDLGDVPFDITADTSGDLYVVGRSASDWTTIDITFPASPVHPHSGSEYDIYVLKLNAEGTYQWHTFYGTAGGEYGRSPKGKAGITVDGSGNVYVTGYSDATWNGSGDSPYPLNPHSGSYADIFVLKLTGSNGGYQWHTFHGGAGQDYGMRITTDASGNVYVGATSKSTWTGPDGETPLHAYSGDHDIVVLKLDSSGEYQWHTFYGSPTGEDWCRGIAVDGSAVYAAGYSRFGWTADGTAPLQAFGGNYDMVVLKIGLDSDACTYTITPVAKKVPHKGGKVTVNVKASAAKCAIPVIEKDADWITVSSNTIKKRNGTIKFEVEALDSAAGRSAEITIGGNNTFTLTQKPKPCSLSLFPASSGVLTGDLNTGSFTVTATPSDCTWTAAPNKTWITVSSGSPGTGTGEVAYSLEAYTGKVARKGKINVVTGDKKSKVYTVKQK